MCGGGSHVTGQRWRRLAETAGGGLTAVGCRTPTRSRWGRRGLWRAALGLVLVLQVQPASAQHYRTETFTESDGLPGSQIVDLAQDGLGQLWIATRQGLSVYDGRTVAPPVGPGGDGAEKKGPEDVVALAADDRGEVWAATAAGRLWVFTHSGWEALPPPTGQVGDEALTVTSLAVVGRGDGAAAGMGTVSHGLLLWDGASWRRYGEDDGLPAARVSDVAAVGRRLAVATEGGLALLAPPRMLLTPVSGPPDLPPGILSLTVERTAAPGVGEGVGERLWALGADWLAVLDEGALQPVATGLTVPYLTTGMTTAALLHDGAGGVFFGTPFELRYLDLGTSETMTVGQGNGLIAEGVTSLFLDRGGSVWVGGLRGLTQIESRRFLSFSRDSGLLEDEVTAIAEAAGGRIVFGHNDGLTFLADGEVETLALPETAPDTAAVQRVMEVVAGPGGELWLAVLGWGVAHLSAGHVFTWYGEEAGVGRTVLSVQRQADGTLWVVSDGMLLRREVGERRFHREPLGEMDGSVKRVITTPEGEIFVATLRGLVVGGPGGWRQIRHPSSSAANNLYCAHRDGAGELWVGTGAGLYRVKGSELVPALPPGRAVDRPVYFILADGRDRLWLGTDDGVFIWDGEGLRQLSARHGLAGRETNRAAALLDSRGRVWVGTDQGVSLYQERFDRVDHPPPTVVLEAVEVTGHRLLASAPVRLRGHEDSLSFHFRGISLLHEEELLYQWRLEGREEGFRAAIPLADGRVPYTDLAPGRYRFQVRVARKGGAWSSTVSSAPMVVVPPLWRRGWVLVVAVMVVLAVAGVALRWRRAHGRRSRFDHLTGLPGRTAFLERLQGAVDEAASLASPGFAVLQVDVDRLRNVNESLGHSLGDSLLSEVARRLSAQLRPRDFLARLGGDEFAVLAQDVEGPEAALRVARRLREAFVAPFYLRDQELYASASIGIAVGTNGFGTATEVLRAAGIALRQAKAAGRGRVVVYRHDMDSTGATSLELETELRRALERRELALVYQPVVSLNTGEVLAVEALLRWRHPRRGLLAPSEFIGAAEDAGLVVPLGEWVLRRACEDARSWRQPGSPERGLPLNVNISARQLEQPDLVGKVEVILAETGLEPQRLRFEITESIMMERGTAATQSLRALKDLGVHLSIDDFGIGHSSLGYLQAFPVDSLKVDRSFVAGLGVREGSLEIVRSIVSLGHNLGLEVIAEGVESESQVEALRHLGCDAVQGYLFSYPVAAGEVAQLLESVFDLPVP